MLVDSVCAIRWWILSVLFASCFRLEVLQRFDPVPENPSVRCYKVTYVRTSGAVGILSMSWR